MTEINTKLPENVIRTLAERVVEKYHNLPIALRIELEGNLKPDLISMPERVAAPEFITEEEAAHLIGYSRKYLQKWRKKDGGPPFIRKGRTIRYNRTQLLGWMSEGE